MSGRRAVLAFLVALSIITYLDRVCISVAGVRMQEELGISPEHWGWVLGVFSIAYGLFEIPTGAWGDRYGQRRLLLTRFLFGVGEAGAYPNMAGAIGRWFSPTERARAQGAVWAASRLGGALSPLIVVPLMASLGWRSAFYVFGCVGVVWALLWSAWYRDPPTGVASHAGHAEIPWAELLRSRQFWLILAMAWCYGWGAIFFLSWFPTYLEKARGLTEEELTYCAALPFVMGAIGNLTGGAITDRLSRAYGLRFGRRLVGSASLAVSALLFLTTALTTGKAVGVIALTLGYGAMDCMLPASWANCLDVGGRHGGAVSGAMNSVVQVGGFLSTVLFGYLMKSFDSYNAPLFVIAPMMLISAVLFARIDPTQPLIPATPREEEVVCA
jgi:MFS transporter, ACS family, glucarate transporter